ncbi:hypothetical protein BpHYR1_001354, partial [Brachionus plicatilis]
FCGTLERFFYVFVFNSSLESDFLIWQLLSRYHKKTSSREKFTEIFKIKPYPYQYPFTYQPQQQLIFTPQNQQLLNQYQQLMMFQQATLNQQRTNVEPEPSTESPNEINQNQQDEANLKTINNKKERLSLGEYKDSDLISEIHKHKPNIYVRKSYINENDELVILTTKEEDHEELKKEWANTVLETEFSYLKWKLTSLKENYIIV